MIADLWARVWRAMFFCWRLLFWNKRRRAIFDNVGSDAFCDPCGGIGMTPCAKCGGSRLYAIIKHKVETSSNSMGKLIPIQEVIHDETSPSAWYDSYDAATLNATNIQAQIAKNKKRIEDERRLG